MIENEQKKIEKEQKKIEQKTQRRLLKKQKRNALVWCRDSSQFWTTQKQFWQWVREAKIVRTGDGPLAGKFIHDYEEKLIVQANTVLNLSCPNHLREVMFQRKFARFR